MKSETRERRRKKRYEKSMEFWLHKKDGPVVEIIRGERVAEFKESTQAQHEYRSEYLRSDHWKELRLRKLRSVNFVCDNCRIPKFPLDVHHLTYVRRGNEDLNDLQVLCRLCHEKEHSK